MEIKSKRCRVVKLFKDLDNGKESHLYITSDDEIKGGDWFITTYNKGKLYKADRITSLPGDKYGNEVWFGNSPTSTQQYFCRKVIATTDKSLTIPSPSKTFIEKYCELSGIDEIDVEYYLPLGENPNIPSFMQEKLSLKISSNNTITIHPIKDSWSRDEVMKLMVLAYDTGYQDRKSESYGGSMKTVEVLIKKSFKL